MEPGHRCRHAARTLLVLVRPISLAVLLLTPMHAAAEAALQTRNVVLVTLDGVRNQDIFAGLDEIIAQHDEQQVYSDMAAVRQKYSRASAIERREALLPNFWQRLAPQGIVLGNAALGSPVKVQNEILWSTPGYTEMLTGRPRADVIDNDNRRYDYPTALDLVAAAMPQGAGQVAQLGSAENFSLAASQHDDTFPMVGLHDSVPPPFNTPEIEALAGLRREVMGLWEEGSDDVLTFRMAQGYLKAHQPRLLWLALGNSDDWAHADRYDRYLDYLHLADALLGELWDTLQSLPAYRDQTTLIITTDHGRGLQGSDWAEHEKTIPGSDGIWLAVIGPDTPDIGEVTGGGTAYQGQLAATLVKFFGLDHGGLDDALPPLSAAFAAEP